MSEPFHISVVILAAGQGTRMKSTLPKVLHPLAGRPLLGHVITAAQQLHPKQTVVVFGHGGEQVQQALAEAPVQWVEQAEQLGTGHAVQQALPAVDEHNIVLVLYGDVPLLRPDTLGDLVNQASEGRLSLLTVHLDDPQGYGRIVRDGHGHVQRIVEEKDASDEEKAIREVNTGILAVNARALKGWLNRLDNNNAQGEYYLTDIIEMAVQDGLEVKTAHPASEAEVLGVNSRSQLAYLERTYQRNIAERLMAQGVTVIDPARLDVRGDVTTGRDVTLDANVLLEGEVEIGDTVSIGPNCVIRNSRLADGVTVHAMSIIEDAVVGADSEIGPFARVRPGSVFAEKTKVGNFVEVKNAQVGKGSKINHLSYVGDTDMGAGVNIGAGTITCNYDGANKHRTVIGDNAFIGSDTQLVAPVTVGKGATIGAGSTITRDAPEDKLTLSRPKQTTVENWQRPVKKPKQ